MNDGEEYQQRVMRVLIGFQWLESALKNYLTRCEIIIRHRVEQDFKYTASFDFMEAPLGVLVTKFAKHCGNEALVERVRAVVKDRNRVAHRSFVLEFEKGSTEIVPLESQLAWIRNLEIDVRDLPGAVAMESAQLHKTAGHLFGFSALFEESVQEMTREPEDPPENSGEKGPGADG